MSFSRCPVCYQMIVSSELFRHVDSHFLEEQCSEDFRIAEKLAFDSYKTLTERVLEDPQTSFSVQNALNLKFEQRKFADKYASLALSQKKERYYQIQGGLMTLLKNCLESDKENSISILSSHVDHFQTLKSEDNGWGCGWRNIQMLSSHLLSRRQEANKVLFGGSGFVPDIASLQRWLEFAWEKGFDSPGSDDFDHKIFGKSNWIGTTECATLFRSFGLRARIADFYRNNSMTDASVPVWGTGKNVNTRKITQIKGPMDRYLSSREVTNNCGLIDWVWDYFSKCMVDKSRNRGVFWSEKAPLYFQHDGHSRTIVGIQAVRQNSGIQQYNLLIFDPSENTRVLEKSLRANHGWQKLIKRGAHTLVKPQYQICFIHPGIAEGEELEKMKSLHSIRHNF